MFLVGITNDVHTCLNVDVKNESWLWHLHFNHLNFWRLKLLPQGNMSKDLPNIRHQDYLCEVCTFGGEKIDSPL